MKRRWKGQWGMSAPCSRAAAASPPPCLVSSAACDDWSPGCRLWLALEEGAASDQAGEAAELSAPISPVHAGSRHRTGRGRTGFTLSAADTRNRRNLKQTLRSRRGIVSVRGATSRAARSQPFRADPWSA